MDGWMGSVVREIYYRTCNNVISLLLLPYLSRGEAIRNSEANSTTYHFETFRGCSFTVCNHQEQISNRRQNIFLTTSAPTYAVSA